MGYVYRYCDITNFKEILAIFSGFYNCLPQLLECPQPLLFTYPQSRATIYEGGSDDFDEDVAAAGNDDVTFLVVLVLVVKKE